MEMQEKRKIHLLAPRSVRFQTSKVPMDVYGVKGGTLLRDESKSIAFGSAEVLRSANAFAKCWFVVLWWFSLTFSFTFP